MRWPRRKKPQFVLSDSVLGRLEDVFYPECRVEMIEGDTNIGRVTVHFSTADQVAFLRVRIDPSLYELFESHLGEPTEFRLTVSFSGDVEIA